MHAKDIFVIEIQIKKYFTREFASIFFIMNLRDLSFPNEG